MKINPDSPIMVGLTKAFDAVAATFYFLICCIPIITIGASLTALWKTMMSIHANRCSAVTAKFFGSFRSEFKQSTLAWLIMLLLGLLLGCNIWVSWFSSMEMASGIQSLFQWITILFGLLYACVFLYLFAGIAKFVVTLRQAFVNAFLFVAKYMLQTFLLLLLLATLALTVYIAGILSYPVIGYPLAMMVLDLKERRIYAQMGQMNEAFHQEEIECCAPYDGKLLCNTCDGSIFVVKEGVFP